MKSTQGAGLIGDKTFYFRSIILLPKKDHATYFPNGPIIIVCDIIPESMYISINCKNQGTLRKLHIKHWFDLNLSMQLLFGIPIMTLR